MMRDDRGAMMMLTAILLVIGFIALAGMAGRLSQIPEQSELARQEMFFDEAERVVSGTRLLFGAWPTCDAGWPDDVAEALAHLQLLEAGRGFSLNATAGVTLGSPNLCFVDVRLSDERATVSMRVEP